MSQPPIPLWILPIRVLHCRFALSQEKYGVCIKLHLFCYHAPRCDPPVKHVTMKELKYLLFTHHQMTKYTQHSQLFTLWTSCSCRHASSAAMLHNLITKKKFHWKIATGIVHTKSTAKDARQEVCFGRLSYSGPWLLWKNSYSGIRQAHEMRNMRSRVGICNTSDSGGRNNKA